MRSILLNAIVFCMFIPAFAFCQATGDQEPSLQDILSAMATANDYFMNKWPDPGEDIVTDKVRPSNIWTRATYYEGLMAYYRIDPKQEFYDYAVQWGQSHSWGLRNGSSTRDADNQCCGQTYIELYEIDPQPERIADIKYSIDQMVNSTKIDDWSWVDALQMAMPVFAKLGALFDDDSYYEKLYEIYNYTKTSHGTNGLYNPEHGLWWRDRNFDPPYTTPNGQMCYWSRGNGWVFAALARVLDVMPEGAPHRQEYLNVFVAMAHALAKVQREDGFWNVSLHDPDDYGGKEVSGTAFFVYGMAWGVNQGILSPTKFKPIAFKGWNGMVNDALHSNGALGYVQSTASQPSDGQPLSYDKMANFEDYGLGAFLLAGSEICQLSQNGFNWDKAYLLPPVDGEYTFWLASDAPAEFWLSTDALSENAVEIASVPDFTLPQQWSKYPEQNSTTISLLAGRKYFMHVNYDSGNAGGYYAVAWQVPNSSVEQIADDYIQPWQQSNDLPGDYTGNSRVDINDLIYYCGLWLDSDCNLQLNIDLNGDCIINLIDFDLLAVNWLESNVPPTVTKRIEENQLGYIGVYSGSIDNNHAGFTGDGFVNTDNAQGQYIQWQVELLAAADCSLQWKFANGAGDNRYGSIIINGEPVNGFVDLPATGTWDTWDVSEPVSISMSKGINTIQLKAETVSGLANIDWFEISGPIAN